MRLLLDTHTVVWAIDSPRRLSAVAREILADTGNERIWSVASAWELANKVSAGRLGLSVPLMTFIACAKSDLLLRPLGVELQHVFQMAELPRHHRDPFDRMLVAQAQVEGLSIVSADPLLSRYEVEVLW